MLTVQKILSLNYILKNFIHKHTIILRISKLKKLRHKNKMNQKMRKYYDITCRFCNIKSAVYLYKCF